MRKILAEVGPCLAGSALWFAFGMLTLHACLTLWPPPVPTTPPAPVPAPMPAPVIAPKHAGHLWVSYVEPVNTTPASAAVRDDLAAVDWHALGSTFRAYTDGQAELHSLGFATCYAPGDLPIVFIQESQGNAAPIVDRLKSPASAQAVLDRIKELRGK